MNALWNPVRGYSGTDRWRDTLSFYIISVVNKYHTHHGETIGVLTSANTLGYNAASDPRRFAHIAELLGTDTSKMGSREAASATKEEHGALQQDLNIFQSGLAELAGIDESDLDERTVYTQAHLLRANP